MIQPFVKSLLSQRSKLLKAEQGNTTLSVRAAFEQLEKNYQMISQGRFKSNQTAWANFFRNNEGNIRRILFGKTAPQYNKLNEAFNQAWLEAIKIK